MTERTLAIIKPCAVKNRHAGEIISAIEEQGFSIVAMTMTHYAVEQAEIFYSEHRGKPFFDGLIEHAISGPIICLVLEGDDVVAKWRKAIGPTNPNDGNGLRSIYGLGLPQNALHGSDSAENARNEISLMFYQTCDSDWAD